MGGINHQKWVVYDIAIPTLVYFPHAMFTGGYVIHLLPGPLPSPETGGAALSAALQRAAAAAPGGDPGGSLSRDLLLGGMAGRSSGYEGALRSVWGIQIPYIFPMK